jgi:hypothetical protein
MSSSSLQGLDISLLGLIYDSFEWRKRVRENEKVEVRVGIIPDKYILRANTKISGFECSQEVPTRPSGNGVLENRQNVRKWRM